MKPPSQGNFIGVPIFQTFLERGERNSHLTEFRELGELWIILPRFGTAKFPGWIFFPKFPSWRNFLGGFWRGGHQIWKLSFSEFIPKTEGGIRGLPKWGPRRFFWVPNNLGNMGEILALFLKPPLFKIWGAFGNF